mmetsp:Transcript_58869/g.111042  ORF Transcript_58869/g.111042 Transcript_58869/m.111042 type:complete len:395 (-) Transcript_58869:123-1307(-)
MAMTMNWAATEPAYVPHDMLSYDMVPYGMMPSYEPLHPFHRPWMQAQAAQQQMYYMHGEAAVGRSFQSAGSDGYQHAFSSSTKRRRRRQKASRHGTELPVADGDGTLRDPEDIPDKVDPDVPASSGDPEIDSLIDQVKSDVDAQISSFKSIRGHVWYLSQHEYGCRLVQMALAQAGKHLAEELVSELHGHVLAACRSRHANYVIAKVIEEMAPASSAFVAKELKGLAVQVSGHRFGCRIMCRLLEHCTAEHATTELVEEIMAQVVPLSQSLFGHFVIGSLAEHLPERRRQIIEILCDHDLRSVATHPKSCQVIEKVVFHNGPKENRMLTRTFLGNPELLVQWATHQYGHIALKALLSIENEETEQALFAMKPFFEELNQNKYGHRVLESLKVVV